MIGYVGGGGVANIASLYAIDDSNDIAGLPIIYSVSVDPWVGRIPSRLCKDEAHWPRNHNRPMSFVFTYSGIPYLDTLGIHANWIDYRLVFAQGIIGLIPYFPCHKTHLRYISLNPLSI